MRKPSVLRRLHLILALAALFASALARAAAPVPPPLRSAIIVRSVGYERGFSERSGDAVLAIVVGKSGVSAEDGRIMAEVFDRILRETRIAGRKTRVVRVAHESAAKTAEELRGHRAEIVYFSSGLEGIVKSVSPEDGGIRRILVCANGSDVAQGCTLGVELDGDKPRLVLNLKQGNAAGLRFAPGLLRLARIVR